jgi:hypothetical protein
MVEKRDNAFRIDVVEVEPVHVPPTVCREEAQEECDSITVAQSRIGAQPAHTRQIFGEEASEGARQGIGGRPCHGTRLSLAPQTKGAQCRANRSLAFSATGSKKDR